MLESKSAWADYCKHLLVFGGIMNTPVQLSLEQQFNVRAFSEQVKDLSREQAQDFLVDLYRQMMIKETMYKGFLMQQLGVNP
jgi:Phycobilisome degradation protein nblA